MILKHTLLQSHLPWGEFRPFSAATADHTILAFFVPADRRISAPWFAASLCKLPQTVAVHQEEIRERCASLYGIRHQQRAVQVPVSYDGHIVPCVLELLVVERCGK